VDIKGNPRVRERRSPHRGLPASHEARLITCEKDSFGFLRARERIRYATSSTESVFVAMHRTIHSCVPWVKLSEAL